MKKLFIILFAFLLFCSFGANNISEKETENTNKPAPAITENEPKKSTEQAKIILALPHYLDENTDLSAGEIMGRRVDISFAPPEDYDMDNAKVMEIEIPPELLAEIKADYPEFDNNKNWKTTLSYYSSDLSAGMIKIIYVIGDKISTDKAMVCSIENGKIIRINYTNMEAFADEERLLEKVENFEKATVQAKKIFEEGEEFLSEDTSYRYCIGADKLIYTYQLFFYEETPLGKVINNDFASEYFIE